MPLGAGNRTATSNFPQYHFCIVILKSKTTMKLTIVLPVCTAHEDATFSPKGAAAYRNYNGSCSTASTGVSSDFEACSFGSSESTGENRDPLPQRPTVVNKDSKAANILKEQMYNTLVVGNVPMAPMDATKPEKNQEQFAQQQLPDDPNHSNCGASFDNQTYVSQDDIYQKLVVGHGAPNEGLPGALPFSHSFHSVGSNFSRQIVYQASSHRWNPEVALPPDIEEVEEEPENKLLEMIENGEMYRALVVAPLMMAAASVSNTKFEFGPTKKKAIDLSETDQNKSSVGLLASVTTHIEKEVLHAIDAVRVGLFGGVAKKDDQSQDGEASVSLTKLTAELRKQRLTNQTLQNERDTANKENSSLREELQHKLTEIDSLLQRIRELEDAERTAKGCTVSQSIKAASAMNELLEALP